MLCIDSRKESKFSCRRSIIMEIPGRISLLKLLTSIQELILIPELVSFLVSILIPLLEQIAIPRSVPIPKPTPDSESIPASESAPELVPNTESESGRSDSELSPLVPRFSSNCWNNFPINS